MTVRDPVCGMSLESDQAKATSQYRGTTYYFCNTEDKATFDKNPERYAVKESPSGVSSS